MLALLKILNGLSFTFLSLFVLASPWMLGGWEMWYFWPLTLLLFIGIALAGLRLLIGALVNLQADGEENGLRAGLPRFATNRFLSLILVSLPFLVYATIRFTQAPVVMDAQRIWLLFVTSFLLIVTIWLTFTPFQKRLLFNALLLSVTLQVLYAFVAFHVFDDRYILWTENIFGYAGRMKGSFFCPNHFAGFLELGICLALAVLVDRTASPARRIAMFPVLALCLAGILSSQSRGGMLTVGVILLGLILFGLKSYPGKVKFPILAGVIGCALLLLAVLSLTDNAYKRRFLSWHVFNPKARQTEKPWVEDLLERFSVTSRGSQIGGALRAWNSEPVWGIGPGMHQNRWFEFAATDDGDRETGQWPTRTNHTFHSFEVHSDWVQLLEEFGLVGFLLFLLPAGYAAVLLAGDVRRKARRHGSTIFPLAALLAWIAIAFHSLGDFNLQIPGVTWTFAAILALGLSANRHSAP